MRKSCGMKRQAWAAVARTSPRRRSWRWGCTRRGRGVDDRLRALEVHEDARVLLRVRPVGHPEGEVPLVDEVVLALLEGRVPAAPLEADDAEAGLGELAGDDAAPRPRADHDRVDLRQGHGYPSLFSGAGGRGTVRAAARGSAGRARRASASSRARWLPAVAGVAVEAHHRVVATSRSKKAWGSSPSQASAGPRRPRCPAGARSASSKDSSAKAFAVLSPRGGVEARARPPARSGAGPFSRVASWRSMKVTTPASAAPGILVGGHDLVAGGGQGRRLLVGQGPPAARPGPLQATRPPRRRWPSVFRNPRRSTA